MRILVSVSVFIVGLLLVCFGYVFLSSFLNVFVVGLLQERPCYGFVVRQIMI